MAKKKQKKYTQNQASFAKERKRIQRFMRRAEKRGFTFEPNIIPDMPSRVTAKQLEKIKALKPEELYKRATYRVPNSNVSVTGTEGRALERSMASLKAAETVRRRKEIKEKIDSGYYEDFYSDYQYSDEPEFVSYLVYDNVQQMIDSWFPAENWSKWFAGVKEEDKNQLKSIIQGAESQYGITEVARRMEENADRIISLAQSILYESGGGKKGGLNSNRNEIQRDFVEFASILKGSALTLQESADLSSMEEEEEDNS